MKTKVMIAATAALLTIAGNAFAEASAEEVQRLEQAKSRLAAGANSVKPNQAMRMRNEADKLQGLIDEIESGKTVDKDAVDQAIKRSKRGY